MECASVWRVMQRGHGRALSTHPHLTSREPAAQALADCVVDALHYGAWLPGLLDVLLSVIRDGDWWSSVRSGALDACLDHLAPDHAELVSLLDALGTGRCGGRLR